MLCSQGETCQCQSVFLLRTWEYIDSFTIIITNTQKCAKRATPELPLPIYCIINAAHSMLRLGNPKVRAKKVTDFE
jgi:hypothetical protein